MKSIPFLLAIALAGLFVASCKEAKPAEEQTASNENVVTLTADSLAQLKSNYLISFNRLKTMVEAKKEESGKELEKATGQGKELLENLIKNLEQSTKDIETCVDMVNQATPETWTTVTEDIQPFLHKAKATLMGEPYQESSVKTMAK